MSINQLRDIHIRLSTVQYPVIIVLYLSLLRTTSIACIFSNKFFIIAAVKDVSFAFKYSQKIK